MSTAAIEIQGVEKRQGCFQLGPIDITVPLGSIYGLIGPNGSGKTTTVDLILGLGDKDRGAIKVFGLDHRAQEVEIKRRIGYVSPDLSYIFWKKVEHLIRFIRRYYPTWDQKYFDHLLSQFGISWYDDIRTLSTGNRTKLAVAVALAHRPDLLLLDEPIIGVDAVSKKQIYAELLAAVQDQGRTVLITSHNLADIERFADYVGIIKNGKIIVQDTMDRLMQRFALTDFQYTGPARFHRLEGIQIKTHEQDRFKALLDLQVFPLERLLATGAQVIHSTPITLEELFVNLVEN